MGASTAAQLADGRPPDEMRWLGTLLRDLANCVAVYQAQSVSIYVHLVVSDLRVQELVAKARSDRRPSVSSVSLW